MFLNTSDIKTPWETLESAEHITVLIMKGSLNHPTYLIFLVPKMYGLHYCVDIFLRNVYTTEVNGHQNGWITNNNRIVIFGWTAPLK